MKVLTMENWSKKIVGSKLVGRWTNQSYRLIRFLGEGATGVVYLAKQLPRGPLLALKMSEMPYTISSEVNILKKLGKNSRAHMGPKFYHMDDGELISVRKKIYFYTMEYIEGMSYTKFIEKNGQKWAVVFLLQLLKHLSVLHQARWSFGDLKVDNIMISSKKQPQVRWFDVGGFTSFGRSIKEYTEFYDQGYWGVGTRQASVQYDLFASSMIFLEAFYPKRFEKVNRDGKMILRNKIQNHREIIWFLPIMENIWNGKYKSALHMHRDVRHRFMQYEVKKKELVIKCKNKKSQVRKTYSFVKFLLKTSIVAVSILGGYILYLFYQTG